MNRTSTHTALAATGVGVTLLLAGCGSGSSGSSAGSPPASQVPTATSTTGTGMESPSRPTSTTSSGSATPSTRFTGSPVTHPAITPRTAPVPRCTVDQLRLSLGDGNADMQGAHWALRFTNTSGKVCKLTGAPGVSYVAGSDGHQVGLPARRVIGHQPVVLIPNATASAGLFTSSAPEKSDCQQVSVRGLRVYPPDSRRSAYLPHPAVACAGAKSGPFLRVGPILPGPNNADV